MGQILDNHRSTGRVKPHQPTVTIHGLGAKPIPAIVLDESFGGLGLAAPTSCIEIGTEIDIELSIEQGGVRSFACVRHASPLPSGCRLGIEWKAQALSRRLRELLAIETCTTSKQLARILPGGLSMMWKLVEAGRWQHLIESAERLKKEASLAQATELTAPIERFQDRITQLAASKATRDELSPHIRTELDALIQKCIEAIA